jgi:hypothetical protein
MRDPCDTYVAGPEQLDRTKRVHPTCGISLVCSVVDAGCFGDLELGWDVHRVPD